jgi:hypothetical protein
MRLLVSWSIIMGSEGIGLDANPQQSKAFWALLHAAIKRANQVEGQLSPLDIACIDYTTSLPKAVREMIARKAQEK